MDATLKAIRSLLQAAWYHQEKRLESGYLWMGQPVKKIRKLTDDEIENIEYSAKHYVKLAQTYKKK